MSARFLIGDVFDRLATLEDESVDLVVTSPPFLALRSYLPADHPDKSKEIGSETTPAEFIDVMLRVTAELRRVLAPHGSICVELGDTYAGSSQEQREDVAVGSARWGGENGQPTLTGARGGTVDRHGSGWPLAKSKALIAELYRIGLAYGVNPLTGQESPAGRWRIRNVVTWVRPNPPVGALGDKWRPATSDLVVACISGKRYWDDLATRKPTERFDRGGLRKGLAASGTDKVRADAGETLQVGGSNTAGAPLLDWWEIPPGGYKGSHYAVFPEELVVPCVQAMCPPKVCRTCGEPSRRVVEKTPEYAATREAIGGFKIGHDETTGLNGTTQYHDGRHIERADLVTAGWSDCGHDDWRPGLILDPFAGSGTTLAVATGYGHDAIGIDLDPRNAELALDRVGPFLLEVEPRIV